MLWPSTAGGVLAVGAIACGLCRALGPQNARSQRSKPNSRLTGELMGPLAVGLRESGGGMTCCWLVGPGFRLVTIGLLSNARGKYLWGCLSLVAEGPACVVPPTQASSCGDAIQPNQA